MDKIAAVLLFMARKKGALAVDGFSNPADGENSLKDCLEIPFAS